MPTTRDVPTVSSSFERGSGSQSRRLGFDSWRCRVPTVIGLGLAPAPGSPEIPTSKPWAKSAIPFHNSYVQQMSSQEIRHQSNPLRFFCQQTIGNIDNNNSKTLPKRASRHHDTALGKRQARKKRVRTNDFRKECNVLAILSLFFHTSTQQAKLTFQSEGHQT